VQKSEISTLIRGIDLLMRKEVLSSEKSGGHQKLFAKVDRTQDRKKALRLSLRSRKRPIDGHLAGLLTYASMSLKLLPGPSQWHVAQVLSAYSCGAVADSHRASHYQMEENLYDRGRQGQVIW
jgi:hypothetical protein